MDKKVILIPEYVDASGREYLRERGYELLFTPDSTKETMLREISKCDGLLTRICPCGKDVLERAERLRVIAKHGIGVDNIDVDYCTQNKIQITFTPLANSEAVAEHALYMILACSKNGYAIFKHFREGHDFEMRNKIFGIELSGRTAGILGLGRIGKALARKCMGIGMQVIGYDPYVTQDQLEQGIRLCADRSEVFREADFISLHLPCNAETRGSIGAEDFAMMKKSAFFINVSRGGVVREPEMIAALLEGKLAGAGIDVFEQEPPSPDNPLFTMDNVITTPHQGGATNDAMRRMSLHAAMGIDEVLSGKPVSWPLNKI